VVSAIGVTAFFIYTLTLRTDYKETARQINDVILANRGQAVFRIGETEVPAGTDLTDYYNMFLQDPFTIVYSRKKALPSDDTVIVLEFGQYSLSFEKLEDGSATLITWITPEKQKQFCVRSQISFMMLRSYGENYVQKKE
jgi:hypothetical protein